MGIDEELVFRVTWPKFFGKLEKYLSVHYNVTISNGFCLPPLFKFQIYTVSLEKFIISMER